MKIKTDKVDILLTETEVEDLKTVGNLVVFLDKKKQRTETSDRQELYDHTLYVNVIGGTDEDLKVRFRHPHGEWFYN